MTKDDGAYRFLTGADMEPGAVLARFPGARFVARARLDGKDGEIWGIVVRLPVGAEVDRGVSRAVVADDGRRFEAAIEHGGRPVGEPAAVVAAARYWELPPAYVRRLAAASGETGGV